MVVVIVQFPPAARAFTVSRARQRGDLSRRFGEPSPSIAGGGAAGDTGALRFAHAELHGGRPTRVERRAVAKDHGVLARIVRGPARDEIHACGVARRDGSQR